MATATESIESLRTLLAERDATIATIKERTRTFVEKLKTDHAEALVQEQTSRQQVQDKLEAVKPIFIGLKDEKIALTKEVTELKEQLRVLEQEHNKKLLKIEKNHELSSKAQEQKLSAAKEATMKEIAAKNESEISVRSLQEMLSSAKQEMITFAQNATHDKDLLISKMNNNLQAAEEAEKKQAKQKLEALDYLKQLEASKAVLMTSDKELTDQLQLRNTELVSLQSKLSAAESQVVLTKKDSQRDTANAASVADLEKTVSVLQESVKVLNSQLSASKEAEGSAKKNLQEEIKRREIDIVEGKKAISAERDTLLKEHTSLKLQHAAQSKEIADKEEANRNLLKQFDELKQNLLESETRLMEAEEAAWKTKAEAAEILYALELEQSSVKKLNDELDIIRKDAPQVQQLAKPSSVAEVTDPKKSTEGTKDCLLLPQELQSSSTENGDLNGEDEVARLTAELTAEAAAHAISIANLRSELTLQSDKAANFEATASKSQASLAALQDELKTSKKQYEVSAVVAETAKAELTKLESVHAGQNVESEKAIAGLKSDAAALILRISELQESLTAVKEKEAHSEETLSVARLNQGRLEELQEMLTNVREELRVAKLKEAAVNPLEEQLVDAIEELERERLERDQALSTCLAAATEKHNAVIAGLKSKHSLAMAAQEEELKIEEKVASAKEMLSKLKEIISGHVSNEDELNKSITKLTGECARLSESLEKSAAEVTKANVERTLALENLKKSEDRVGQSVQEKATITNSLNETLIKLQSEQSIVKDKEGRLVELQMSLESAQKSLHDLKVQKESEVKSLAEQLKESRKELEQAKHGFAEQLAKLTAESVTAPKEAEASALAMTAALGKAKAESAALITSHEGKVKELESMLAQMQSKLSEANQQIATAAEKLSDLTTQHVTKIKEIETEHSLKVAEHVQHDNVTKKDFEGRTQEQTAMQSNLEKNLAVSEEKLKSSTATQISLEKSLKELKESSEEKLSKLNGEIQKLESALGSKKADLDATKANLAATTTAYSALSAQHNQLKIKTDNLTQQLEAEVSQTQERKQKVRAYVDNLNVEKREMEVMKQGLLDQLAAAGAKASQLENQIAGEEMKLKKEEIRFNTARQMAAVELEQQQQDHASKIEAKEGLFVLQVNETKRLQGLLDEHARATAEEVQEAYRQMALSGKELESHKAKRLVARNEMIGAAQALERSQSEGQALRAYIQYKLAPIVFEQIGALEMLLSAVEHFRMQMATKGNVRLHNTANEFLSRRLLQSGLSPSSPNISPESSVSSTNSNTGLNLRTINGNVKVGEENELKGAFHASRPRTEMETGMVRANNSTGFAGQSSGSKVVHYSPPGSGANNNVTILGEAMEQAEILRVELNRVHAGLSLLSHSVDRLGDVVTVNSKCCGGVFQMFSETVTGSIEGSIRGSLVGRTLVSHNNTSTTNSSSRRPDSAVGLGLSGLISNLGYATVNGDDNMNSGHNSGNGSPRDENIGMKREGGKKPMAAKTSVFSILPDDEDDDGEELEMI